MWPSRLYNISPIIAQTARFSKVVKRPLASVLGFRLFNLYFVRVEYGWRWRYLVVPCVGDRLVVVVVGVV